MRRYAIALAGLLVLPTLASAQAPRRSPGPAGSVEVPQLADVLVANREFLGLGDDQVSRLRELGAAQRRGRDELRQRLEAARGDSAAVSLSEQARNELRDAMRATRQGRAAGARELRSILSVEQMDRVRILGGVLHAAAADRARAGAGTPGVRGRGPGLPGVRFRGGPANRERVPGLGLQRPGLRARQFRPAPTPRDRATDRRNPEETETER